MNSQREDDLEAVMRRANVSRAVASEALHNANADPVDALYFLSKRAQPPATPSVSVADTLNLTAPTPAVASVSSKDEQIANLTKALEQSKENVKLAKQWMDNRVAALKTEMEQKDAQIAELRAGGGDGGGVNLSAEVLAIRAKYEELRVAANAEVSALQQRVQERETEIQQLIGNYKQLNEVATQKIEELEAQAARQNQQDPGESGNMSNEIAKLRSELRHKDEVVAALQARLQAQAAGAPVLSPEQSKDRLDLMRMTELANYHSDQVMTLRRTLAMRDARIQELTHGQETPDHSALSLNKSGDTMYAF